MTTTQRVATAATGSLYGLALGDALGAPTEFMGFESIVSRYGPLGPEEPPRRGGLARVTDDTQMALAVGEALLDAGAPVEPVGLEVALRRTFVEWLRSPDNNRAPGNTCLQACAGLEARMPWTRATVQNSKGCGANMRVAPVALVPGLTDEERAAAAQFQAALTHGHPTALAASDLTARAVWELANVASPSGLPARLREYAQSQREVYHAGRLDTLWQRPGVRSPEEFISRGWDECLAVLDRLDAALAQPDRESDPCLITGAGWIAEEAFATGLLCFLLFPDEPVLAIRRGAASGGDSDSIACLAGAFAGACHGVDAWPPEWREGIEYRQRIERLGRAWDAAPEVRA
jgi:ADP-ribosylglycohydrolase